MKRKSLNSDCEILWKYLDNLGTIIIQTLDIATHFLNHPRDLQVAPFVLNSSCKCYSCGNISISKKGTTEQFKHLSFDLQLPE